MRKLTLRQLILLLTVSTALLILGNTFYTSYKTQRTLLIEQTLETNQAYASKLASNIEDFLVAAQQQLAFAAQDVILSDHKVENLDHIVERLIKQTDSFNSVLIVNAQGEVISVSETAQNLLGKKLQSTGSLQALKERKPLISEPYNSNAKASRSIIFISHPVFDAQGSYLGFVGGSIYLNEKSILYSLLGEHYHADESYIYVVDRHAHLIYHQDSSRVGENVSSNPVVANINAQQTGSQQLINSKGIAMLAGYAPVPSSGWGVVTQRSLAATLMAMNQQMLAVAKYSFPMFVLIMWVVWVVSRWISRPLWQLAHSAEYLDRSEVKADISGVSVWYFEATQLKRAMLRGLAGLNRKIGQLSLENMTDPLTGLLNRRGMQVALDEWQQAQQPFSIIMTDIDYFKRINDEFGHDTGDKILKFIAKHMQESSRPDDVICRVGGEEFVLLLPEADQGIAYKAAERLRARIESDACPCVGRPVTLSFGVSSWSPEQSSIAQAMKNADQALYVAKNAGRNRVCNG
ncbi:GGDEF domain-containing protein [Pseudomonas sp. C27(2019)]|uniref:sensor domain-containing diguanylate cyclase n=1 Tax=Pseudomonas sp. C27(2019) TaxID=2604941 RepID=UPI0012468BA5|nr:sensor domain-containing diguanylate cyclase [Pseudomonas sp. C27(2019)]QEY59185.1 GGDEF domain-containing protein [Pseudomonas sp. C27(2019)]